MQVEPPGRSEASVWAELLERIYGVDMGEFADGGTEGR